MFGLSLFLVLPSVVLLRWVAQTNLPFKTWVLAKLHLAKVDRTRKPRTVWANPIAWREAKTKASAAKAGLLRYSFIVLGLVGAAVLLYRFSDQPQPAQYILPASATTPTRARSPSTTRRPATRTPSGPTPRSRSSRTPRTTAASAS